MSVADRHDHGRARLAHLSSGSGERIVLVHGFTQSSHAWDAIAGELSSDYEVIAVDLPGHGDSSDVRITSMAEGVELLAQSTGRATYIGYSLGGRTCLCLALAHPELVERLVLIGASPGIADRAERSARVVSDNALADRLDPPDGSTGISLRAFLDRWLAGPLFAHLTPESQNLEARLSNTTSGLAHSLRTMGAGQQVPSHDEIAELVMPALLIAGELDTKYSAIAREMQETIGDNARSAIIAGVGHAACFETPERFVSLVREFLAEHAL